MRAILYPRWVRFRKNFSMSPKQHIVAYGTIEEMCNGGLDVYITWKSMAQTLKL